MQSTEDGDCEETHRELTACPHPGTYLALIHIIPSPSYFHPHFENCPFSLLAAGLPTPGLLQHVGLSVLFLNPATLFSLLLWHLLVALSPTSCGQGFIAILT